MPAETNLTNKADINGRVREIDFVTRFADNWNALTEIMGIMRPTKKVFGTKLTSYKASMKSDALQGGAAVGEGEEVPFTEFQVEPVLYSDITLEKYAKSVSAEAIASYGVEQAVEKTDEAFLNEITGNIMDRFYAFLQTGTLTSTESTFQMAMAMAIGKVIDKFKKMRKGYGSVVVFVNTLDAYRYLGAANITVQNQFGLQYIKDFMGASTVILSSEIPENKVIATAVANINLFYIDPADAELKRADLDYTTSRPLALIGAHTQGNYRRVVSDLYVLCGLTLWAEYLDAIAVITVGA